MKRKLSVTAACNAANHCVGKPVKFSPTSWQVFYHEPDKTASRVMQADSYTKALTKAIEAKALIAIELLGESWGYPWNDGPDIDVYVAVCIGVNWREVVKEAHNTMIGK